MGAIDEVSKVSYDFRNQNGGGIWLPPNVNAGLNNLKRINPYAATAEQLYPIGAIGFLDQRKFAYCYMSGALKGWSRLVVDDNYIPGANSHLDEDGFEGNIYLGHAAGDTVIEIEDATARAKNYYQGGYLALFDAAGTKSTTLRIAASDVGGASAHNGVTLYLDDGLPWAIVNHDWCSTYRSPYSSIVEHSTNFYECFMGLSLIDVTSTYYSWLQIAGPAWLAQTTNIPGATASQRDVYAHIDGTGTVNPGDQTLQYVGYLLGRTESSYGDTYTMLQMG